MHRIKKIIILSLVITLPITILYLVWINTMVKQNEVMDKVKLYMHKGDRLYQLGLHNYYSLYNKVLSQAGYKDNIDVNILIPDSLKNEFYKNMPPKDLEYEKVLVVYDNQLYSMKTKLRGDNFWHWLYDEKSWRIKTKKSDLINSNRKVNFIVPKGSESLSNHILSFKLAKALNLLAPESSMKSFYINGNFNDYRMMLEQIDENFLRKNHMMPNDIYKGDMEGQSFIFGVNTDLFNNSSIWSKSCINNHYEKDSKKPLEELLREIDNDKYSLYDINSFASFLVFIDLTASYHYDANHNWLLLYDNYYEKFYPIIWDPNPWRTAWLKGDNLNIISAKPLESLYKNYDILKRKYEIAYDFSKNKESEFLKISKKQIQDEIDISDKSLFKRSSVNDKLLHDLYQNIKKRTNLLNDYLFGNVKNEDYAYAINDNKIRFSINNSKMIKKITLKLKNRTTNVDSIRIYYKLNDMRNIENINFVQSENSLVLNLSLLANSKMVSIENTPWKKLTYTEATYDLEFDGLDINNIKDVQFEFLNMNDQIISVNKVDDIEEKEFQNVYNVVEQYKDDKPQVWSDTKFFSGFSIIRDDIIIKPGTKIIFDANATIKVFGKVTATGTKEKPIIFEAKNKTKPWNAFALKDAKANGSVFKYCIFKDGSGDKGELYEYTAMFSVHNVKDLLVEDCEFYDSHRTDDMVHVIYSDATFKNTKFVRSLSDALDVDISNVVVDNCEFIDSGNDSIDLMTTNAIVINTRFTNSIDKGISIGEGSNLLAVNNYIKGSEIGMQSKDTSKAYIYNTSFIGNKKAVDAYHKNWRYSEGGTIVLESCIFEENIVNATVGKKSKVVINNSDIDTPSKFDKKSLKKKKIIISHDSFIWYDLNKPLFENKSALISQERRGFHE